MKWFHAAWQAAMFLTGLAAGYGGLARFRARRAGRKAASGAPRRFHRIAGWIFTGGLAVGYGLGLLSVHRAGRPVLASVHALVGTTVLMLAAVAAFCGTALAGREERSLARLHALFGCAALVAALVQAVLGVGLLGP